VNNGMFHSLRNHIIEAMERSEIDLNVNELDKLQSSFAS
jgi:hypothetical protein